MPHRPLGLAHFTVLEVPPPELVSLAARIGYATVGLRLVQGAPGTPYYPTPAGSSEMRDLKLRLDDTGIRVHDVEIATIDASFSAAQLTGVLESAAEFGARTLSVCGDDPDRARLTEKFVDLCDLAAGFGIGVDLEWMAWRWVRTLADALAIVTAADHPNGAVLVDALHLTRTGSAPKDLRAVPPGLIRSAQLCDARAEAPTTTEEIIREARSGRLPPGMGVLPLGALLAELPIDAAVSLEVPMGTSRPPEERAGQVFAAMQTLLQRHGPS